MARIAATRLCWVALVGAVVLHLPPPAAAQQVNYYGALQTTTGRYVFQQHTTTVSFWSGVDVEMGRFRIGGSIPFILQSTPWVSWAGSGMLPSGGPENGAMAGGGSGGMHSGMTLPDTARYDRVGVGDPTVTASFTPWRRSDRRANFRLIASVKAPIATPTSGFGTGAWDYGVGAGFTSAVGEWILLAEASYWSLGDLPDLPLKETVVYSLAAGKAFGPRVMGLASVLGSTPLIEGVPAPLQLGAGATIRLAGGGQSLGVMGSFGATRGSPDFSLGLSWRVGL